jgi:hypothetical protein
MFSSNKFNRGCTFLSRLKESPEDVIESSFLSLLKRFIAIC